MFLNFIFKSDYNLSQAEIPKMGKKDMTELGERVTYNYVPELMRTIRFMNNPT